MVRWLEANGYDVSYFSEVDTERNAALILNHKVWMSNGHDEYWSAGQRASVQAARDAGVHLAFFSGNTMFWKTRWENSIDGSNTSFRTLVCYKETHANAVIDPADPPTWTGTWRDPRFSPPADGGKAENALVGTLFRVNGPQNVTITVPQADGQMRFWRNTSVATLGAGQVATLAPGTIGAEVDDDEDNGFRPAGLFELSNTSITTSANYLLDFGTTYGAGTAIHKVTLYRTPSRAWVFAAGTYQWSWGLDPNHDRSNLGATTDVRMQQATVNLFADMGVQPATLQAGLTAAAASADTSAPSSTITAPTAGSNFPPGTAVAITGTAADTGGGVVAGVEVSVDGGTTWHPATAQANWSYSWTPAGSGSVTIKSRAVDDSGNLENPNAGITVMVGWTISGTITGTTGVTVSLSGAATATATTDASGNYSFPGLQNGSYKVTPTKTGFTFSPTNLAITVNGGNVSGANFVATATSNWSISGTITGTTGVTVSLSGAVTATATTDASGNYSFSGLQNGSYTVTPTKAGFTFSPANVAVTVSGANVAGINFAASGAPTWSISGSVTGTTAVTVALSGAATATATTDTSGNYSFSGLVNGTYVVTPSKTGFNFTPANQTVPVNGANVTGVNFTAKPAIAIDATVFADRGTARTTVTTPAFSTTAGGELLLAFVSTDWTSGSNTTVSRVTGAGLIWVLVRRTNAQKGTAEIWRTFAASPLNAVTVTATLSQSVPSSMTVMSFTGVNPSGTNGSGAIGATGTGNASSGAPTASLVTTRNNSWVFGVGNDFDNAIARAPGPGQGLVHQFLAPVGDTYWVQMQNAPTPATGTTVIINDTAPTTDRYNLTICEVLAAQ
jgi:hypothetical protein